MQKNSSKHVANALFAVDEKVLCYEPDPTKAKVLYDSKVLEVVERKDKGKKTIEYRIHFQGWNSSWDRFVDEMYILKRDEENLALQVELKEKAAELNQAWKLKKKKPHLSISELIRATVDKRPATGSEGSAGGSSSGDSIEGDVSEIDDTIECVPIVIPVCVKQRLEDDYYAVTEDEKLVHLPANVNVTRILEDYVKHYALTELAQWIRTMKNRAAEAPPPVVSIPSLIQPMLPAGFHKLCSGPSTSAGFTGKTDLAKLVADEKNDLDELNPVVRRFELVKEIVEGIRILFDFLLRQILLYKEEVEQFKSAQHLQPIETPCRINVAEYIAATDRTEFDSLDFFHDILLESPSLPNADDSAKKTNKPMKKFPRKCVAGPSNASESNIVRPKTNAYQAYRIRTSEFINDIMDWKLVPPVPNTEGQEFSPSSVYGGIHLLRTFVKLPDVLSRTNMPRKRLSAVVELLNEFITYFSRYDSFGGYVCHSKRKNEERQSDDETVSRPKKSWAPRSYTKSRSARASHLK